MLAATRASGQLHRPGHLMQSYSGVAPDVKSAWVVLVWADSVISFGQQLVNDEVCGLAIPGNLTFAGVLQGRSWFSHGHAGIVCLMVEVCGGRRGLTMCQPWFSRVGHTLFTSLRMRHKERALAFECNLRGLNPFVLHDGGDTPQMRPEHKA